VAVAAASFIEAAILYIKTRSFRITESSVITGLIIGYVVSSDEGWRNIIIACLLAISSKYIIRFHKRHIFNPAALGIFLATLTLNSHTQWKAAYLWYILVPFGFYFAYKINKLELLVGYAVVFFALFGAQAFLKKIPLSNIFGYLSYFYIFLMLIEPKTTPSRKIGKYLFGAIASALIFILTSRGVRFDVELFSLLAANCTAPFLNKLT
jgi:Na+-translocating ferredoxin:NAD+ oxidoreductase RnfD subunit